jgi:competence protein ComEA
MSLNLNTAGIDELTSVTGLSRERAQLLLDYREEHGEFRTWDDVKSVPGFSQKFIELLKNGGAFFSVEYDEKAA